MTALHDAARQAALDARDRIAPQLTDYAALTIAEAALAVVGRIHAREPRPGSIDVEALELPYTEQPNARHRDVRNTGEWL